MGRRASRGAGRSWWSIEFDQSISDWLGRCLYPHSRAAAGGGSQRGAHACGVCVVRGVLWPFVSGVSRGLAANAHSSLPLLWHRHARRCPLPGEGRRTAASVCTSAFWTFWSSCTAVMHGPQSDMGAPRGGGWGGGGVPKTVKGGAAHIGVGEVARAVTRPKQPHACTAAPVKGEGGDIPGARGREHSARGDRYCSVQCDVQKQLCPAARGKGRPQGSSRQQWVWVSR